MTFGGKITLIREQRNLSTTKLAKMAGMAQSTLRDIELGNSKATYTSIGKICKSLNMSFQQIEEYDEHFDETNFRSELEEALSKLNSTQKKTLLAFLKSI